MGRPKKPPTRVVRLPVDVVEALHRKAARKGQTLGEYLRAALGLPAPDVKEEP